MVWNKIIIMLREPQINTDERGLMHKNPYFVLYPR